MTHPSFKPIALCVLVLSAALSGCTGTKGGATTTGTGTPSAPGSALINRTTVPIQLGVDTIASGFTAQHVVPMIGQTQTLRLVDFMVFDRQTGQLANTTVGNLPGNPSNSFAAVGDKGVAFVTQVSRANPTFWIDYGFYSFADKKWTVEEAPQRWLSYTGGVSGLVMGGSDIYVLMQGFQQTSLWRNHDGVWSNVVVPGGGGAHLTANATRLMIVGADGNARKNILWTVDFGLTNFQSWSRDYPTSTLLDGTFSAIGAAPGAPPLAALYHTSYPGHLTVLANHGDASWTANDTGLDAFPQVLAASSTHAFMLAQTQNPAVTHLYKETAGSWTRCSLPTDTGGLLTDGRNVTLAYMDGFDLRMVDLTANTC